MKRCAAFTVLVLLWMGIPVSQARAEKLSRKVTTEVAAMFADFQGNAPSAGILVMRDGRVLLEASYGLADRERRATATPGTNYRLASVSKQFTATAILLLRDRGKLSLDDDLTQFFPDFPAYGKMIRVRHLLNHTSGLLAYEELLPADLKSPVVDAGVLKILSAQNHAEFPAGSRFRYSNSGYALLACIVEKVSGLSYAEFMSRNIFRPLGMKGTFLTQRERTSGNHRAFGYSRKEQGWVRTDQSLTSFVLGDGGIYSSLRDLRKWEAAVGGGKLLSRESLNEMMTSTIATQDEAAEGYGFGWFTGKHRGEPAVWHTGSTTGFRNAYLRIPGKSLTVIVLTNRNDANAVGLARKVADTVLRWGAG